MVIVEKERGIMLEILTAMIIQILVFCFLTVVLEGSAASILWETQAACSFETFAFTYKPALCHNPYDDILNIRK
jgi:hypothetical protein